MTQENHDKIIKEKEVIIKARECIIDKLEKDNIVLVDDLVKAKQEIERLKNPEVASKKPGSQRGIEGIESQERVPTQEKGKEEKKKYRIPKIANKKLGPHRGVEGNGPPETQDILELDVLESDVLELEDNLDMIQEAHEVVEKPVEATPTTVLKDNKTEKEEKTNKVTIEE